MALLQVGNSFNKEFYNKNKEIIKLLDNITSDLRRESIMLKEIRSLLKNKNNIDTGMDLLIKYINDLNIKIGDFCGS
jgi:hypothetical protein